MSSNDKYRICFYNADGLACVYYTKQPTPEMLQAHQPELVHADHDLNVVNIFTRR